jgi:hypothetical protein
LRSTILEPLEEDMKESSAFDPFAIMQRGLPPASAMTTLIRQNAGSVLNAQDKLLDHLQQFANGWFERRHIGTRESLACARQMCDAETPFDAMREYQKWAIGSFERVMRDGAAMQKHMIDAGRAGAEPLVQAAETVRSEAAAVESEQRPQSRARAA